MSGCELDTDGDGNCPRHPDGCPEPGSVTLSAEGRQTIVLRDVDCAACGAALMRGGEMGDVAFMVPPDGDEAGIRCEPCARREGLWDD